MAEPTDERRARRAAALAAERPAFLAWTLARFQEAERLDDIDLARLLGMEPTQLSLLGLCRHPRQDRFRSDVTAIAERFGLDPLRLASLIRQVDALQALGTALGQDAGVLAEARDRETDAPPPLPDDEP